MTISLPVFRNGEATPLDGVPCLGIAEFRAQILSAVRTGYRLTALFGMPAEDAQVQLIAILADSVAARLIALRAEVKDAYPCLTVECPQAHWFEREIAEQWDIEPQGHPWLKPLRFQPPYRSHHGTNSPLAGVTEFFQVHGQ